MSLLGAAGIRQHTRAPERADQLAGVVLERATGGEVRLGDLWRERPVALAFLRHYGWVFCREHAVQLHRAREEFEAAGVNLVVIGQGSPEDARRFMRKHHVEGLEMLVDPDRSTYVLAGTKVATRGELLGPGVVAKGVLTALRNRVHQGLPVGHPAQLGGVLVIAPDGRVTWSHLAEDASDNPPNERVLEAARAAAGGP